ncbi:MAG: 50S ribosomal protein L10 [Synergistota bacterium]|nr:50S ribosomal protein L10 [Synergistota bacterium]
MPSESRIAKVAELREKISGKEAIFISEYRGLTVSKITDLRSRIRQAGGEMHVAKNKLMKIAMEEESRPLPQDFMAGPNAFTVVTGDAAAVAKVIKEFAKEKGNEALVMKGAIFGEDILDVAQVQALAELPTREVLLSQLVGSLASPMRGFVTVLSGPARGLATCLSRIRDDKEKEAA